MPGGSELWQLETVTVVSLSSVPPCQTGSLASIHDCKGAQLDNAIFGMLDFMNVWFSAT